MTDRSSSRAIPESSIVLGFGPMLVLPVLAVLAWSTGGWWGAFFVGIGQLWAGVLLIFIAGVRRGLSFGMADGPRPLQLATMMWLFVLGLAGVALPWLAGFCALLIGYGSVAILDPRAAKRGEVPAHFARLRPPQMAVAILGLTGLLLRALTL
ncbi:DUF3429 family protein [Sphingomonas profundi]|uniref:DUF3429 family protein n=1 Tax=Alterirhizorhabdus profundi TaxID=2681549 RepID=UPI0012E8F8BE|nr:DUF3429 family protein [Sphingomonas profundi]